MTYIITLSQIYEWLSMKHIIDTQKYKHTDEVIEMMQADQTKQAFIRYEKRLLGVFLLCCALYSIFQVLIIFRVIVPYSLNYWILSIWFTTQETVGLVYSFMALHTLLKEYHQTKYQELKTSLIFFFVFELNL
jgi:hypothetical protein